MNTACHACAASHIMQGGASCTVMCPASLQAEGVARLRGCYFHPGTGLGVFGAIPVVAGNSGSMPDARLGVRYSTATTSLGAVIDPFLDTITQLWAVTDSCHPVCPQKKKPFFLSMQHQHLMDNVRQKSDRASFTCVLLKHLLL